MRFSPPLQVLERGPGGEVSESPEVIEICRDVAVEVGHDVCANMADSPLISFEKGVRGKVYSRGRTPKNQFCAEVNYP